MTLPRLQTLAVTALLCVLAETAFAQSPGSSASALTAAARSSIRAQTLANWTAARARNQQIMNAAKAGPSATSALTEIIANINATKAENKDIRAGTFSVLQASLLPVPLPATEEIIACSTRLPSAERAQCLVKQHFQILKMQSTSPSSVPITASTAVASPVTISCSRLSGVARAQCLVKQRKQMLDMLSAQRAGRR